MWDPWHPKSSTEISKDSSGCSGCLHGLVKGSHLMSQWRVWLWLSRLWWNDLDFNLRPCACSCATLLLAGSPLRALAPISALNSAFGLNTPLLYHVIPPLKGLRANLPWRFYKLYLINGGWSLATRSPNSSLTVWPETPMQSPFR